MINLLRIKIEKEKKNCIEYYKKNINTDEFKEYVKSSKLVGDKNHCEYIKKEHPEWINRTDYYDNGVVSGIDIYDVLSNSGVGKLLKKLYALSKKEYNVKNYYKKPTSIQKYDYIRLQYSSYGYGQFAEIIFLNDKYIDGINISWAQINNYFALFEYKFKFKKCLDDTSYSSFILDNIDSINRKDYFNWYNIDNNRHVSEYYLALEQMHSDFFSLICQHYITSLLFSEQGQTSQLINLIGMTRKEPININTLYLGDISLSYHNKNNNYIIFSDFEETNHTLIAGNNSISHFSICSYIARYGNKFYYKFFGYRELKMFEREFSKYTTGRKRILYNKKIKDLLMRIQSTSEQENRKSENICEEFDKSWDFYISNSKTDLKEFHKNRKIDHREIYRENFSYLQLLLEINNTKSNHINAIVATIASIIATIIAIIALVY